ncbi:MAG: hypothetical protein Q9203_004189 [Teloschistes exilis]
MMITTVIFPFLLHVSKDAALEFNPNGVSVQRRESGGQRSDWGVERRESGGQRSDWGVEWRERGGQRSDWGVERSNSGGPRSVNGHG